MDETPQTEDGFTRIANELMDALARTRIPGEARQVLDAIIRKTYGWQKTSDDISLSQFMLITGLKKPTICKAIKKLISMNIIIKRGCADSLFTKQGKAVTSTYSVQKNHKFWKPLPKKETLSHVTQKGNLESARKDELPKKETLHDVAQSGNDVTQKGNKTLPKKPPTIESLKKTSFSPNSVEYGLAKLLFDLILKRNPGHKHPELEMWAGHIDDMIKLDGRKPDDIKSVIVWCQSGKTNESKFWMNNILSTDKLRQQFDTLRLKKDLDEIKQCPRKGPQGSEYFKPIPKPVRTAAGTKHIKSLLKEAGERFLGKGKREEMTV
jgi:phage replication O-like protein O